MVQMIVCGLYTKEQIIQIYHNIAAMFVTFGEICDAALTLPIPTPVLTGVTALGISLTTLFFCMEMFSQLAQFRVERIEDAIRIGMKFVVAKVIIENTAAIAGGIKEIFSLPSLNTLKTGMASISVTPFEILANSEGGMFDINYIIMGFWAELFGIVSFVICITIIINVIGIIFEIAVHQAVAPIALSTLCNDTVRQTGISFIKSYAAVCLQIGIIGVMLTVYRAVSTAIGNMDYSAFEIFKDNPLLSSMTAFFSPLLLLIVLSKAIKTSSDITKRMFGA